jgi:hypothetical protein
MGRLIMRAQLTTELLFAGAALLLVYGVGSTARADDALPADPFAAVQTIEQGDLDGLRGGDLEVEDSYNTTVEATNKSKNTIGNMTINASGGNGGDGGTTGGSGGAGGTIAGGSVSFNDNALQNFGGVYTNAINTAPGGISTALTSMTINLNP